MTRLFLLEPEPAARWLPFCDCRPICELRAGAWLVRERWEALADGDAEGIFGPPHLHAFAEEGVPPLQPRKPIEGPVMVGCSDFAPEGAPPHLGPTPARLANEGATVGWWVPAGETWSGEHEAWDAIEVTGVPLHGAYDVITALELLLAPDTVDFTREQGDPLPDGCMVIGDPGDVVILGARVEPGVIFDVRNGVVVLEQHSYVRRGTRFEGPTYVGPGTTVLGGDITQCSIGPRCKIRGEMTKTVFLGYANKAHDGFVGDSVIGRWANLGANTVTSNLKNSYGAVRLDVAGERIETGRQFLGSLIGDHAKTAIGVLLGTGTVVGVGANVAVTVRPPKYVPPFTWADVGTTTEKDGFVRVVERVMPRRQVEVTDEIRAMLDAVYDYAIAR